jgi:uncharacterized protein (TIGR03000 family)
MRRTSWLATSLVFVFALSLLGGAGCGKKPEKPGKSITLKVLLPQEDARVEVDGKVYEGKGTERTLTPAVEGKDTVEVKATWEPNNYTKITRPRKVIVKDGEITVDFRQRSDVEKDDIVVRWVPTPQEFVDAMCKMARVTKDDVVYDLGCGDGRMVITAVKDFGARKGVGVDIDPDLVKKSQEAAKKAGVADRVEFRVGDVLKVEDLSDATVVLLYMGDDINARLKPILQKTLKPGARVVSHRFKMGDDWPPERSETVKATKGEYPDYENQIHLWTIKPSITLLLPQDDAVVKVDGKEIEGKGIERILPGSVAAGKDTMTITAFWEPNNYTKITRPRKVVLKDGNITVDFRSPSDKEKDDIVVRFVPTPQEFVDAMCKLAKVTKDDVVYDLGCGDGRMVITAVKKFGAKRGVGVDIDPDLVKQCKEAAKKAGVADRVEFRVGDVLKVEDLSDATVVLLYMGDDINARLKPILKKTLKPGSRVVSHRFTMGEDWPPERSEKVKATYGEYPGYENEIHLWTIGNKQ